MRASVRLFHGDNLSALRRLADEQVRLDLVYLDPPFGVGVTHGARTSEGEARADRSSVAYGDAWCGIDAFLASLQPRLAAVRAVLDPRATLYLHLDARTVHEAKVACDGVMGRDAFRGEIVWSPGNGARTRKSWGFTHQTILVYTRDDRPAPTKPAWVFRADARELREPHAETSLAMHFKETADGRRVRIRRVNGRDYVYDAADGRRIGTVWTDVPSMAANSPIRGETTGYPHQKPEKLLSRIIAASSEERALVADFFCGSGTTLATAVKMGRRAVGGDASALAIEVTKKRLEAMGVEVVVETC